MTDLPIEAGSEDIFDFPCDFPIKIMGRTVDNFAQTVMEIVLRHAPDFNPVHMEMRASSSGKYLSVTCTIRAVSRAQLDDLYRDLSGHPMVVMVL
jgi:putative lipoic acid-binding regulatory protein